MGQDVQIAEETRAIEMNLKEGWGKDESVEDWRLTYLVSRQVDKGCVVAEVLTSKASRLCNDRN